MILNPIGAIAAITTIISIWFGHVMVRKLEAKITHLKLIILSCLLVGLGLEVTSILVDKNLVSTVFGIVGITILWDALEFIRQEKRVQQGHAPANPENPRHARILVSFPDATIVNLVNRNPRGKPYSAAEIKMLLQSGRLEKRGESE